MMNRTSMNVRLRQFHGVCVPRNCNGRRRRMVFNKLMPWSWNDCSNFEHSKVIASTFFILGERKPIFSIVHFHSIHSKANIVFCLCGRFETSSHICINDDLKVTFKHMIPFRNRAHNWQAIKQLQNWTCIKLSKLTHNERHICSQWNKPAFQPTHKSHELHS